MSIFDFYWARRFGTGPAPGERDWGGGGRGGRYKFWGARGVYSRVDQTKKVKTKEKKVFSTKISTNSCCRLKIFAIFYEFLSEDQKKRGLRLQSAMKFGVSPQKLRKNSSCSRILGR